MKLGLMSGLVLGLVILQVRQGHVNAQDRIKSFTSTSAFIGIYNEYVEPSVEESILKESRVISGRYTSAYRDSDIQNFKLLSNPNNQYLKTSPGELSEGQKQFLRKAAEDNRIDIIVLNVLRESPDGLELEIQLYDSRIDQLSAVETARFAIRDRKKSLEDVLYRAFNYLDRDGFVHPEPQELLEKPGFLVSQSQVMGSSSVVEEEFATPPEFLGRGELADDASIGGDQTPFWEKWWFWTAIGGGIITASSLTYYFLVVDQPPNRARLRFNLPDPQ